MGLENESKTGGSFRTAPFLFRMQTEKRRFRTEDIRNLRFFTLLIALPFAAAVFCRCDADNLFELVHEMHIVAVSALVGDVRDAVICAGKQAL